MAHPAHRVIDRFCALFRTKKDNAFYSAEKAIDLAIRVGGSSTASGIIQTATERKRAKYIATQFH